MEPSKQGAGLRDRWSAARATKTAVFWLCAASAVLTMVVGFAWGGWVTGGTAAKMAEVKGEEAVLSRLAPMCVLKSKDDPKREQKLVEFKEVNAWEKGDYVKKQGWATMPGEREPDGRVAEACAKLLL